MREQSIFENSKNFIKIYETEDGYKIFARFCRNRLTEYLKLEVEGNGKWKMIKIKQNNLVAPNAVVKEIRKHFKAFLGCLSEKDTIENVAVEIERKWDIIPRDESEEISAPTAIYEYIEKCAKGRTEDDEIIFESDDKYYIRSTCFNPILAEANFDFKRVELLEAFKDAGLLHTNSTRNDYLKGFNGGKQEKYICLKIRDKEKSEEITTGEGEEHYVEKNNGDRVRSTPRMGGKGNAPMNDKIQMLIPNDIKKIVEPYAGSASVSVNCRRVQGEYVFNDIDSEMANLLRVMTDAEMADKLIELVNQCDFSETDFNDAKKRIESKESCDLIKRARDKMILLECSYNASEKYYSSEETTQHIRERLTNKIRKMAEKMRNHRVITSATDAIEVIKRFKDDENAFLYIDPPYVLDLVTSKRLYDNVLEDEQQRELMETIRDAKCKILLSGYLDEKAENDLYCNYLDREHGWSCLKLGEFSKASSNKKDSTGIEFVWLNYPDEIPEKAWKVISRQEYGLEHGLGAAFQKGGVAHE